MSFEPFAISLEEKDYSVLMFLNDKFLIADEDGKMKFISNQELTNYKFEGFLDSDDSDEEESEE